MIRLLVTGAGGQVGRALLEAAPLVDVLVTGLGHSSLDITRKDEVAERIAAERPDIVVNAAAYTAVDKAESETEAAFAANETGPANLAAACDTLGMPLIHLSTDYVFDGRAEGPYGEDDPVAPLGTYGRSKEAGERAVRRSNSRHVILRTAWVFGASGHNFLRTVLRLAEDRDELRIVDDQYGCPTPARDIADAVLTLAPQLLERPETAGTYHFCGAGPTTWFGFADAIVEAAAPLTGRRPRLVPIPSSAYPTPAPRPANSVLDCRKIGETFGIGQRPWREGLAAALATCFDNPAGTAH
ncbi:MAG: dTDP-4-dehydrorhamnose reductase [Rhodospirillaceae bacterium]|nr:dTDP-4-dehydrorhamnose reductase [Rhodospirillaceae bacterium]